MFKRALLIVLLSLLGGYASLALADEPAPAASKFLVREECRGGYAYMARYECVLRLWKENKPYCGRWELQDLRQLFWNIDNHGLYKSAERSLVLKECK